MCKSIFTTCLTPAEGSDLEIGLSDLPRGEVVGVGVIAVFPPVVRWLSPPPTQGLGSVRPQAVVSPSPNCRFVLPKLIIKMMTMCRAIINDLPPREVRRILAPSRRAFAPNDSGDYEAIPRSYDPLWVGQPYQINPGMGCPPPLPPKRQI